MQIKKDYLLHLDVRPGDIIYQYTTVCVFCIYENGDLTVRNHF